MISDEDVAKCLAELTWDDRADEEGNLEAQDEKEDEQQAEQESSDDIEGEESFDNVYAEVMRLKREQQAEESIIGESIIKTGIKSTSTRTSRDHIVAEAGNGEASVFSLSKSDFERWQQSVKGVDGTLIDAEIDKERERASRQQVYDESGETAG